MLSRDSGIEVGELSQAMTDCAEWHAIVADLRPRMPKDDNDDNNREIIILLLAISSLSLTYFKLSR